jgi:hypothetical protein
MGARTEEDAFPDLELLLASRFPWLKRQLRVFRICHQCCCRMFLLQSSGVLIGCFPRSLS